MKCRSCGHWNRIEVKKIMFELESLEPKVKVFLLMYMPLKNETCKKCKTVIAQPKELIRIVAGDLVADKKSSSQV